MAKNIRSSFDAEDLVIRAKEAGVSISDGYVADEGKFRKLNLDLILEDKDNRSIYGEDYKTDDFAQNIKNDGFRGAVFVYPDPANEGKYILEAGHRTAEAARKAGLAEVDAIIVDPPADEITRRQRLNHSNANNRRITPMQWARKVKYELDTIALEDKKLMDEKNLLPAKSASERAAERLGLSAKTVYKYNALNTLINELQMLCDDGTVSWTALSGAAPLDEKDQKKLLQAIKLEIEKGSGDSVTREWIEKKVKKLKSNKNTAVEDSDKRKRSIDGAKAILKGVELIRSGFGDDAKIKPNQREDVIRQLEEMKELIEKKIEELR